MATIPGVTSRIRLVVATRGSMLALAQTGQVVRELARRNPGMAFPLLVITTPGDRSQKSGTLPGGTGIFTKALERALLDGRADLAVHSMKDLPTAFAPGTAIGAVTRREDPRDALISRRGLTLARLPRGARVGTSSPRRQAELLAARPDLVPVPLRGNLDTRVRKLRAGKDGLSAIIVAMAGLRRSGKARLATQKLPPSLFMPSAGQGALALQVRAGDARASSVVRKLDHPATRARCGAERAVIAHLRAGCTAPLAVHAAVRAGTMSVSACAYSPDGKRRIKATVSGPYARWKTLARRLGASLSSRGARRLIRPVRNSRPPA